jgi:hypothetical protein
MTELVNLSIYICFILTRVRQLIGLFKNCMKTQWFIVKYHWSIKML